MEPTEPVTATAPTPAELAAEAEQLADRRDRLASVRNAIAEAGRVKQEAIWEANRIWSATLTAAEAAHADVTGPIAIEETELVAAIATAEAAAIELENRRKRAAELRAALAQAEADLPPEFDHVARTPDHLFAVGDVPATDGTIGLGDDPPTVPGEGREEVTIAATSEGIEESPERVG